MAVAARPIRTDRTCRTPGDGRPPRRRRPGRRDRGALGLAFGRGARRRGRGIAARPKATISACALSSAANRRSFRPTISKATASTLGRTRGRHGARRAGRPLCRARRSGAAGAETFPALDLLDPEMPGVEMLEARAREAEAAGLAVTGVSKSGGASASAGICGLVLVTSHGFRGATIGSRHGISMTAIAGDGTGMESDYDYSSTLHAADLESAADDRAQRRRTRGQAPQSAQGRHPPGPGRVRFENFRVAGRPPRQRRQRQPRSRARPVSCAKSSARGFLPRASTSSTIRCGRAVCARGRSTPKASPEACANWSRTAYSRPGFSTARLRASSTCKRLATPSAACRRRPRPVPSNLHLAAGRQKSGRV